MEKVEIEQLAEAKAQEFNPEGLAPFPYQNVIDHCQDLELIFSDTIPDEVSGAVGFSQQSNKFRILINRNKPQTRQNFTVGHELGHYFLHKQEITSDILIDSDNYLDSSQILYRIDNPEVRSKLETEANNFSAALLMPKTLVEKAWIDLKSIEECAQVFSVSVSAMSIRLERLELLPSV